MSKYLNFATKVSSSFALRKFVGFSKRNYKGKLFSIKNTRQTVNSEMTTWWDLMYYIKSTNNPNYQLFLLRLFTRDSNHSEQEGSCYLVESRKESLFLLVAGWSGREAEEGWLWVVSVLRTNLIQEKSPSAQITGTEKHHLCAVLTQGHCHNSLHYVKCLGPWPDSEFILSIQATTSK